MAAFVERVFLGPPPPPPPAAAAPAVVPPPAAPVPPAPEKLEAIYSDVDKLVDLGIAKDRVRTVSYGEERPICRESNEECRSKNRRADFVVK